MLINSDRLSDSDRAEWARLARIDTRLAAATRPRLDRLADTARDIIDDFAARGPCQACVSWGKDSVAIAHLVATSGAAIPLVYATSGDVLGRIANPDAPAVRDAFLAEHRAIEYVELTGGLLSIGRNFGSDRRITGIRAAESGVRRLSQRAHGVATEISCRPIIAWTDADLWGYLALHDLPVHPAYAMSYGGVLDRSRIRVHSIGGEGGGTEGRIQWEDHYYGDLTQTLRGWTQARP